jgi:hypothetical protein
MRWVWAGSGRLSALGVGVGVGVGNRYYLGAGAGAGCRCGGWLLGSLVWLGCSGFCSLTKRERELSRRKPSLLCLRLKLAKQGCFHPRDVLPKQSTASAGLRMAARPLGQRITGDPRSARVHRATTTAPLSPPSASNQAPAPVVVDLGRALGRGERGGRTGCRTGGWGTALPIPAPGWQLGCMYQVRRGTAGRLAHSEWASRRTGLFAYLNGLGVGGGGGVIA